MNSEKKTFNSLLKSMEERRHPCEVGRHDIFSTPIHIIKVDLDKLKVPYQEESFAPTFESQLETTFAVQKTPKETFDYLNSIIGPVLNTMKDKFRKMRFENVWRNRYKETDFQAIHIHPDSQWSFIIYEDVYSKTVFQHPAMYLIQNQCHCHASKDNDIHYAPHIPPGHMILFPSWIGHHVLPGNVGHTIAGNICLEEN